MGLSVIVAPDSFKGSLSASAAARAISEGWREVRPDDDIRMIPQADGGEGTLEAIEAAVAGTLRHQIARVTGPDGRSTTASWLELPNGIAVVELAESSGLPLMATADALGATTRGLGEVIGHVLTSGARSLIIALGGSASTDGGAGALQALGLRLLRADGSEAPWGGGPLRDIVTVDRRTLVAPPPDGVILLTDVTIPLLGAAGAATVFAPQKGANSADVNTLEASLTHFARILGGAPTAPGAGAAGGTAYGFATVWGATIESGAARILRLTGLDAAIERADVVLTGEGRFDASSLAGKVVGQVLARAGHRRPGIIAGSATVAPPDGCWVSELTALAGSAEAALAEPERWLRAAGNEAARHFAHVQ